MSSSRDILLQHGGCWEGLNYTGGEREVITIDFGPLCYDELLNTVIECTAPIPNDCMVLLHSLQDEGDGTVCKKRIRKASDMNYIFSQTSNVQRHSIFVTIKKMGNVGGRTSSRDHQIRQPAFDARTFGNVSRDPHLRQQLFDDRTFARDPHVRQQQAFDDKCIPPDNPKQAGRQERSSQSAGLEGASSSRRKKQARTRCGESDHNRAKCKVYMDLLDAEPAEPDHDLPESSVNVRKRAHRKCSICMSTEHLKNKCPNKPPEPPTV
ncbi:hypothetical protein CASFOL_021302 [Castilleja foliolosa]|uniref:Uncharacterized protein n=1 Tax=Castilleja foliolosa TaxID=1961234 RepID=A0ABD3CX16_9LAMI